MSARLLVVIVDGAASSDYAAMPSCALAHRNYSRTHTPAGFDADSLCCIMNMLGAPVSAIPRGRACLEALALGINVGKDDLVLRANGIEIADERLISSCAARSAPNIPSGVDFYAMGAHKNLLVLRGGASLADQMTTFPPHEHLGEAIGALMPCCKDAKVDSLFKELVRRGFWVWGQASAVDIPSFAALHGESAAFVAATEIVRGIAAAMNIPAPKVFGATAETDTDLSAKAACALALLPEYDIVFVHINGADEAAHRGNAAEKREFLARIDSELLTPMLSALPERCALMLTSDHATLLSGSHSNEAVNTYIFNPNEESNKWQKYL